MGGGVIVFKLLDLVQSFELYYGTNVLYQWTIQIKVLCLNCTSFFSAFNMLCSDVSACVLVCKPLSVNYTVLEV